MSQRKDSGTGAICPSPSLSNCVTLPQLVAELYGEAAAAERCRILEHLMQPLGVLSLAVVANGIFAKIWFRSGWHGLQVRPEDVAIVQPGDVFELARHTEQVSTEAMATLAQLFAASSVVAMSPACAHFTAALLTRNAKKEVQP